MTQPKQRNAFFEYTLQKQLTLLTQTFTAFSRAEGNYKRIRHFDMILDFLNDIHQTSIEATSQTSVSAFIQEYCFEMLEAVRLDDCELVTIISSSFCKVSYDLKLHYQQGGFTRDFDFGALILNLHNAVQNKQSIDKQDQEDNVVKINFTSRVQKRLKIKRNAKVVFLRRRRVLLKLANSEFLKHVRQSYQARRMAG